MAEDRLESYLAEVSEDLPTVPAVANRVIDAIDDPDSSLDDVRDLIELDAALTARVMKVSNSSLYGFATEINSLAQAISLVGGRAVRSLVMAVALRDAYTEFGPLEKMLWEHSVAAGPVAGAIARAFAPDVDADEAFTVGLLHDIGKTALAATHRDVYSEVANRAFAEGQGFGSLEREAFGFDHAELGARIGASWGLSPRAVAVVRDHHDPSALERLPEADARLTALITVTTACLTRLGAGRPGPVEALDPSALPAWSFLGLPETADAVLEICAKRIEAARTFGD